MAHVNNIWYYEGEGQDWCSTKCGLDTDYKMPWQNGDTRYLQVNYPNDYTTSRVWFADLNGNRYVSILSLTSYQRYIGEEYTLLSFLMPSIGEGECPLVQTGSADGCTVDMSDWTGFPVEVQTLAAAYLANDPTVQIYLIENIPPFTQYNLSTETLSFIYETGDHNLIFNVLCSMFPDGSLNYNFYFKKDGDPFFYGGLFREAEAGGDPFPIFETVSCFRFEVPLLIDGDEVGMLVTEPFECGGCTPTLIISGDYCRSNKDIFNQKVFMLPTEGDIEGNLMSITNEMRIQAVTKEMPAQLSAVRNIRCNNFKSKAIEKFKIQGADVDFPPWMAKEITSVFSAKKLFISDTEYIPTAENLFIERGIQGFSMQKLDAELEQCELAIPFDCSCEPPPVNCDENGVSALMFILAAPNFNSDGIGYFGVDRSYIRAEIVGLTGGVGVVTISGWGLVSGVGGPVLADVPGTDITAFDDTRLYNFFRRTDFDPCDNCLTIVALATDSRGCVYSLGNSVKMDDLRCVGQEGFFKIGTITDTTIEVIEVAPIGMNQYYSFDGLTWFLVGSPSPTPFTITGLTPNMEYNIWVRGGCSDTEMIYGIIGWEVVTTLP